MSPATVSSHLNHHCRKRLVDLFAIDWRSLAILRIGLGTIIIIDLIMRSFDLTLHYTDAGVFPRTAAVRFFANNPGWWSLHLINGSALFQAFLFLAAGLAALAMVLGYRTKAATLLSWILLASLHARNYMILHSGDVLLRMILFWSLFLPLGQRWSLDNVLIPQRRISEYQFCSAATMAMFIQLGLVYFLAGFQKLNDSWQKGEALFSVFAGNGFGSPVSRYLLKWPGLLSEASKIIPWLEMSGALLLFVPIFTRQIRVFLFCVFALFHLTTGLCMENLGHFPYTSILLWVICLPPAFWDKIIFSSLSIQQKWNVKFPLDAWRETASFLPPPKESSKKTMAGLNNWVVPGFVLFFISYGVMVNWEALQHRKFDKKDYQIIPSSMRWIGYAALLQQRWHMFDKPPQFNKWPLLLAQLKDGDRVDILTGAAPVFTPQSYTIVHEKILKNFRWEKLYENLLRPERKKYWAYVMDYFSHQWNATHADAQTVAILEVYKVTQLSNPPHIHDIKFDQEPFFKKDYSEEIKK